MPWYSAESDHMLTIDSVAPNCRVLSLCCPLRRFLWWSGTCNQISPLLGPKSDWSSFPLPGAGVTWPIWCRRGGGKWCLPTPLFLVKSTPGISAPLNMLIISKLLSLSHIPQTAVSVLYLCWLFVVLDL